MIINRTIIDKSWVIVILPAVAYGVAVFYQTAYLSEFGVSPLIVDITPYEYAISISATLIAYIVLELTESMFEGFIKLHEDTDVENLRATKPALFKLFVIGAIATIGFIVIMLSVALFGEFKDYGYLAALFIWIAIAVTVSGFVSATELTADLIKYIAILSTVERKSINRVLLMSNIEAGRRSQRNGVITSLLTAITVLLFMGCIAGTTTAKFVPLSIYTRDKKSEMLIVYVTNGKFVLKQYNQSTNSLEKGYVLKDIGSGPISGGVQNILN